MVFIPPGTCKKSGAVILAVQITLISRNNYFLMTPLLFEAGSGILEPRHAVSPLRPLFKTVRFIEAEVAGVDVDKRVVQITPWRGRWNGMTRLTITWRWHWEASPIKSSSPARKTD